jgi:hypothetical protein
MSARPPEEPAQAEPDPARRPETGAHANWPRLLYGLLGAPLAWMLQMCVCQVMASQACSAPDEALGKPLVPALGPLIGGVSAVCLAIAFGGLSSAWRGWRRARETHARRVQDKRASARVEHPSEGPARFLSRVGVIASAMFVLAVLATALAALIVSPCRPW